MAAAGEERGYAAGLRAAAAAAGGVVPPAAATAALLEDVAWMGGLSAVLACCWRVLAAHPVVRVVAAGYVFAELAFYVVGKLRYGPLPAAASLRQAAACHYPCACRTYIPATPNHHAPAARSPSRRRRHLGRLCEAGPDASRLALLFQRFLQLRDVFSLDDFLSGW